MRELILANKNLIIEELKQIGVDPNAFSIFINKADYKLIKFEDLSNAQAHILKQTALICGADLAIPKTSYQDNKTRRVSGLLFANLREVEKIVARLAQQPWMDKIRADLNGLLPENRSPILKIGNSKIEFNRTYIMGVINLTPDSFYSGSRYTTRKMVLKVVEEMCEEGADFIDVGAESTRPGAELINEKEEIMRLKDVLAVLVKNAAIPISVDTSKASVAALAIDQGVKIINSAMTLNKKMARLLAQNSVGLVIMHTKGKPKTMQQNPQYEDLMGEIFHYFKKKLVYANDCGIAQERIIIDPGLGFGKRLEDNYEIIRRLKELRIFNRPILAGHSRKSFIGKPFNFSPEQRLEGTLGVEALLIQNGVSILRVHDVLEAKRVARLIDKIIR